MKNLNLNLDFGDVVLPINGDVNNTLRFNPEDASFRLGYMNLFNFICEGKDWAIEKEKELIGISNKLNADKSVFKKELIVILKRLDEGVTDIDEKKQLEVEQKRLENSIKKIDIELEEKGYTYENTLKLQIEFCLRMRQEIDKVFGKGSSDRLFGNRNSMDMFMIFLNQLIPLINEVSAIKKKPHLDVLEQLHKEE